MTQATMAVTTEKAAWNELQASVRAGLQDYTFDVAVDDVPCCARVTVEQVQYHAWQEYAVLDRVVEITAEYKQILHPTSRMPGLLLDAWYVWQRAQMFAEIDALYSMLFGPHQVQIEFLNVPATESRRAQAKLSFLMDVILAVRCAEDRIQFCHP